MKEKQIEEMAKVIGDYYLHDRRKYILLANHLYEAGYRKQSEGEWESYYDSYRCPCCKEVFKSDMLFIMESFPEGKLPGCCPNCGAKLKGGEV